MAESTHARKAGRGRAVTRGTANVFADLGFRMPSSARSSYGWPTPCSCWQGRPLSLFEAVKVLGSRSPTGRRFVATS